MESSITEFLTRCTSEGLPREPDAADCLHVSAPRICGDTHRRLPNLELPRCAAPKARRRPTATELVLPASARRRRAGTPSRRDPFSPTSSPGSASLGPTPPTPGPPPAHFAEAVPPPSDTMRTIHRGPPWGLLKSAYPRG